MPAFGPPEPPAGEPRDAAQRRQQHRGRRRQALSAVAVHEAILSEGEEELKRANSALAWSGLTAGLSMGFSMVAEGLLRSHLPETQWSPLLTKLGYPVGFFIVVLGRQQLYTETTLTAVLPVLMHKTAATAIQLGRLWLIVLAANLAGSLAFAAATAWLPAFSPEARAAFLEIGTAAARWSFWEALVKGVYAGWLIALMVWLLPAAGAARWVVVVLLTYLVGVSDLTHIIAGSAEVFYATLLGSVEWGHAFGRFLVPTLIGNTLGGVLLVAAANHAQAEVRTHAEKDGGASPRPS